MKRKVSQPWNMASVRSRTYTPRVTKVHGPVGEPLLAGEHDVGAFACCGYHVCSCERQAPTMELLHCAHCNAQLHEHFWHRCQPVPPRPGPAGPQGAFMVALEQKIRTLREAPGLYGMRELPWKFYCHKHGCAGHASIDAECYK